MGLQPGDWSTPAMLSSLGQVPGGFATASPQGCSTAEYEVKWGPPQYTLRDEVDGAAAINLRAARELVGDRGQEHPGPPRQRREVGNRGKPHARVDLPHHPVGKETKRAAGAGAWRRLPR
jgi:hypothetical protein